MHRMEHEHSLCVAGGCAAGPRAAGLDGLLCGGGRVKLPPRGRVRSRPERPAFTEVLLGKHFSLTAADKFQLGAYRADPAGPAKGGMVVMQEIFGVNIISALSATGSRRRLCRSSAGPVRSPDRRISRSGYTPDEIANARNFSPIRIGARCCAIPRRRSTTQRRRPVGIIGFCMGGTRRVSGGMPAQRAFRRGRLLRRPDRQIRRREAEMSRDDAFRRDRCRHSDDRRGDDQEKRGSDSEIYVYPTPATASIATSAAASTTSAKLAWQRTLDFLKKHMKK